MLHNLSGYTGNAIITVTETYRDPGLITFTDNARQFAIVYNTGSLKAHECMPVCVHVYVSILGMYKCIRLYKQAHL